MEPLHWSHKPSHWHQMESLYKTPALKKSMNNKARSVLLAVIWQLVYPFRFLLISANLGLSTSRYYGLRLPVYRIPKASAAEVQPLC